MKDDYPRLVIHILNALLNQHEQPERQQVRRVHVNKKHHPDYFSDRDATPREQTNAVFQELEREGVVLLQWRKWERGNWLESVDLVVEQVCVLYQMLKRTPLYDQKNQFSELLRQQTSQGRWHQALLDGMKEQLAQHRSVAPFDLDDHQKNIDLLRLLDAIATLDTLTMERTLSTRLFGDSKRLAMLRPSVLTLLRRYDTEAALLYGNDDTALLQSYSFERIPEYLPLAGPLILRHPSRTTSHGNPEETTSEAHLNHLDLSPFVHGLALPGNVLREACVEECRADVLITVENGTSFHELLQVRPDSFLVVGTWGFASPSLMILLRRIRTVRPDLPFFHWGDLDPGGLRILRHLRSQLGVVGFLAMDSYTFDAHHAMSQPLTAPDQNALDQLQGKEELADCHALIQRLRETGAKLEQESVSASVVVQAAMQAIGMKSQGAQSP